MSVDTEPRRRQDAPHRVPPPLSLLDHLTESLKSFPGSHLYTLQCVRSQPRRSYALFPYAAAGLGGGGGGHHKGKHRDKIKIWQEEVLVVLSEEREVPVHVEEPAHADRQQPQQPTAATRRVAMPIVGLEVSIYTIPASSCCLVYVSKVDTTGLSPSSAPSPARTLVASFLSFHLVNPPHNTTRVRIHVFAKSQPMYLFPGSVENKGKRVLDDKGLIRWWKSTLEMAAGLASKDERQSETKDKDSKKRRTAMFYLIPGMNYLESLPYVPATTGQAQWTYGHGYATLSSPLHPLTPRQSSSSPPPPLSDLIPCFPDDPKSRFVTSLTSSSVAASGNQDDYDDVFLSLKSATFATGVSGGSSRRRDEVEHEREREKSRLDQTEGGIEGWWEMMQWRQECCAGKMVAFFLVACEPELELEPGRETDAAAADSQASYSTSTSTSSSSPPPPVKSPLSLAQPVFIRLWSQFHNMDYSESNVRQFARTAAGCEKWREDVERVTRGTAVIDERQRQQEHDDDDDNDDNGDGDGVDERTNTATASREMYEREVWRSFRIENPFVTAAVASAEGGAGSGLSKRASGDGGEVDARPKVNVLAPRKKKVKVV